MKQFIWPVVTIAVILVICRWWPWWPWGKPYHQWFYVDTLSGQPELTDLDGDRIEKTIVVFRHDHLLFVNRTDSTVRIEFDSDNIFGPGLQEFDVEPNQRVKRRVISPSGPEYTINIIWTGGPVNPPKVKVGDD